MNVLNGIGFYDKKDELKCLTKREKKNEMKKKRTWFDIITFKKKKRTIVN